MLTRTARRSSIHLPYLVGPHAVELAVAHGSGVLESVFGSRSAPALAQPPNSSSTDCQQTRHACSTTTDAGKSAWASTINMLRLPTMLSSSQGSRDFRSRSSAANVLPWTAIGGMRGATAQASPKGAGKQQLLRQKRHSLAEATVMEQPGIVHVSSTKNNTILTLTDEAGRAKAWCVLHSVAGSQHILHNIPCMQLT